MTARTRGVDNSFNATTCRLDFETDNSETDQNKQLKASYTYDSWGNVTSITLDSANGSASDRKTEYVYDTAGHLGHFPRQVKRYQDAENPHTVSMTWDSRQGH
jgi:YD repeat-containing protein